MTGQRPPQVFISYSHDTVEHQERVLGLADRLRDDGIDAEIDQYNAAPPEGWPLWCERQIAAADVILMVCTETYHRRVKGDEERGKGLGVVWEARIIRQLLYDAGAVSDKFVPVLFSDASPEQIPTPIKGWSRYVVDTEDGYEDLYRRLTGQPRLVRPALGTIRTLPPRRRHRLRPADVSGVVPLPAGLHNVPELPLTTSPDEIDEDNPSVAAMSTHHERMAINQLNTDNAQPFFQRLKEELAEEFHPAPSPQTAMEVVHRFSKCLAEEVLQLFIVVRRALDLPVSVGAHRSARRAAEEAAAALYCLAACRLVDCAAHHARAPEVGRYIVAVPSREHLVCAIVATALFGGELRLSPSEQADLPRPEYVFDIPSSDGGDRFVADFERAAYVAIFENSRQAPNMSLDDGPLTEQQSADLEARFRTIKTVKRRSLALVVRGVWSPDAYRGFASQYQVPVMVPDTKATEALLGMKVSTLLAEIREFWSELEVLPGSAAPSPDGPSPSPAGGPAMPPSGQPIYVYGNAAISTGSHSAAQTGRGHTAHIDHRQGADLTVLIPLLEELAQEIGKLASTEKRDELTAHVELAQHQAGKKDNPDLGRIKRALAVVKSGAEGLEHGGKIIALCNKAYNVVAPLLGLPLSPLS